MPRKPESDAAQELAYLNGEQHGYARGLEAALRIAIAEALRGKPPFVPLAETNSPKKGKGNKHG
jgi:hypothetical protein